MGEQAHRTHICPHSPYQVPRPLAMKKESIQTRKRKPKTTKTKGSSGVWGAGREPALYASELAQSHLGVLWLVGGKVS
jgi:hypothetical protein